MVSTSDFGSDSLGSNPNVSTIKNKSYVYVVFINATPIIICCEINNYELSH